MAWQDELLDAAWRGVPFDMMSVDDAMGKALAQHKYPFVNGADIQDMGNEPLQIRVRAVFWGDDYMADLRDFMDALEETGPGTLVHPVFGATDCVVMDYTVRHDAETVDGAYVDIHFIEKGLIAPVFSAAPVDKGDSITLFAQTAQLGCLAALQAQVGGLVAGLPVLPGLGGLSGLSGLGGLGGIAGGLGLPSLNLPSLTGLKGVLTGGLAQLQSALNISPLKAIVSGLDPLLHPAAWGNDYLAVITRSLEGLSFGGLNALFDSKAASAAVPSTSSVAGSSSTLTSTSTAGATAAASEGSAATAAVLVGTMQAPQLTDYYAVQVALSPINQLLPFAPGPLATQGLPVGLGGGSAGVGGSVDVFGGAPGGPGTKGGYGYAGVGGGAGTLRTSTSEAPEVIDGLQVADRAAVQAFVWTACASTVAQCAAIVLVNEPAQRALQPADIERVSGLARDGLQVAVLAVRNVYAPDVAAPIVQALKGQALAVQDLAKAAIQLRPPVVARTITAGGHWRLAAHQLYGDASRAPELMRLNAWGRQAMLQPRQEVRAYAQ